MDFGAKLMRVALLWHGDRTARDSATFEGHRLGPTAAAFQALGMDPLPCVYNDEFEDEVFTELLRVDAVQVWVNPITEDGSTRLKLDAMLAKLANHGVLVKTHPETIQKIGTKDVLFKSRSMEWGSDVRKYTSKDELHAGLVDSIGTGPRVLKQWRGHSGQGIWKISPTLDPAVIRAQQAPRGSPEMVIPVVGWIELCAPYLAEGPMIDQPFNPLIAKGTVRCYCVQNWVEGFGHQAVNALVEGESAGPRHYHPADYPEFQALKHKVEQNWIPELMELVEMAYENLPMLWDIDLMYTESGYMLCEINVSSVYPYPESAMHPLARAFKQALDGGN